MDASWGGEMSVPRRTPTGVRYKRRCCKKWRKGRKLCTRCPQRATLDAAAIRALLRRAAARRGPGRQRQ